MTPDEVFSGVYHTLKANQYAPPAGTEFVGWSLTQHNTISNGADLPTDIVTMIYTEDNDMTVYAVWVSSGLLNNYYTVTYYSNGGTGTMPVDKVKSGSDVTLRDNAFSHASVDVNGTDTPVVFIGWTLTADTTIYANGDTLPDAIITQIKSITADTDVYALWGYDTNGNDIPDILEKSVTYHSNYDTDTTYVHVTSKGTYTVKTYTATGLPTRAGYKFEGWATSESGDVEYTAAACTAGTATFDLTESVDLYAIWTENEDDDDTVTYSVTYKANNGTGSMEDSNSPYANNATVTILDNAFTRSGYTFKGFNIEGGDGTVYASESDNISGAVQSFEITSDVTLVAQWEKKGGGGGGGSTSYTVTYNANGGTGSHADSSLSSGATYMVKSDSATGIEREGYTFTGWNTASGGTGTAYSADDTFKISSSVTLYAQWKSTSSSNSGTKTPALNTEDHMAYVIGYPDGTVQPESNITRAEVATIFFRLLITDSRNEYWSSSNTYSDVSSSNWYNNAVSTMSNADIISGYTDGTFGGSKNITRAEFAAITARFDTGTYIGANKFSDTSGHWAAEYINRAAEKGWITGYSDGSFKPDQYITRAEAMTLINRVLGRDNITEMHADMKTWSDNPSTAWYYEAVQEATNSHEYTRDASTNAETWTAVTTAPDWAALEKSWSTANSI